MSDMSPGSKGGALVAVSAVFGAVGVGAGAFGAHALHGVLEASGRLEVWNTAVLYSLVHAVAAVAVASTHKRYATMPVLLWMAGVTLFSGSLYALALDGPRWLGPVTPIGGASLIAGWLWLAAGALFGKRKGVD